MSPRRAPRDRRGQVTRVPRTPRRAPDGDAGRDTPPHGQAPVAERGSVPTPAPRSAEAAGGAEAAEVAEAGGAAGRDGGPVPGTGSARHAGRARRRARVRRRRLLVGVLALVVVLAGFAAWEEVEAHPFGPPGAPVLVTVQRGESVRTVVTRLTRRGVIGSSLAFLVWSLVHGTPTVVPGTYQFHENLPFSTVRRLLAEGPNVLRLDVTPGTTLAEIDAQLSPLPDHVAERFAADAKRGAVRSPYGPAAGGPLEGLIGSGVYQVLPGESARQLLGQMVARFDAEARRAGLRPTSSVAGLSAYQVVTVASIAQKEGYFTRYMGKVARVVYNRLAQGMHLDMTSTVLYSLGQDGGPVTPAEERITTPYNTYLRAGLTPTPICTPSERALAAAATPPAGPWLYFDLVTAKKGVMVFSATYTGQVAAQQRAAGHG